MSFWAYMLHCRGGYFYVGHTDNLELRVVQHQTGNVPGFAADHRPVELVWSDYFQTRDEAKAVERQLKGWSRAKKMALIRGDWALVSALAKKKGSPSTSSGHAGLGAGSGMIAAASAQQGEAQQASNSHTRIPELVEGLPLLCHPQTPATAVKAIKVDVFYRTAQRPRLSLRYRVSGDLSKVIFGKEAPQRRSDELWLRTCFEAFVASDGHAGYTEFNFAPTREWAMYTLDGYREGFRINELLPEPRLGISSIHSDYEFNATIYPNLSNGAHIALSAVVEEIDGTKSYWALAHPPGPPDFHHPDCFALALPAPPAA